MTGERTLAAANVAAAEQHIQRILGPTILMAKEMYWSGLAPEVVYEGLMHESDEVVWGDIPGPAKQLLSPDMKALIKRSADAIDARFGVTHNHKDLVKQYDIRMLATEKKELMPHGANDQWAFTEGYQPFSFTIEPWSIERAAEEFVATWSRLRDAMVVSEGGLETGALRNKIGVAPLTEANNVA